MPHDPNNPPHNLPWPDESDPAQLGERFAHTSSPADRALANSFVRSNSDDHGELGREFADAHFAEDQQLANSFADPNATDDARLGRSFEESESSRKKPPLKDRVHLPHAPRDPRSRRIFWIALAVAVVLFAVIFFAGWLPRHLRDKHTEEAAQQRRNAKPVVQVARVQQTKHNTGLVVPGTTLPLTEAFVYARANGYLKKRFVDIGDHVRKDQLLAIVDAPDLDAQVSQALEQLRQAQQQRDQQQAQLALATVTVNRYRVLVAKGVFSRQDGDTQETNYGSQLALVAAAQRNVDAYQANLRRVQALQGFEYVRAPFAGVITQRNVDVGALISASGSTSGMMSAPAPTGQLSATGGTSQASQSNVGGTSGTTSSAATTAQSPGQGGPLFGIAQNSRLRILVSVPEGYIDAIRVGVPAELAFQEFPSTHFNGRVTRTANSVDPNTRTMLTEVQVDNSAGKLVPGMYVVTTFAPPPGQKLPLLVTGEAVAIRHDQNMVAQVINGKVHYVPVVLGRDFGSAVEIVSGIKAGDLIATNITDDVREGAPVQVAMQPSSEDQPTAPPSQTRPPGGSTQYGNEGITDQNLQGKQGQENQKGSGKGKASTSDQNGSSSESRP